MAESLVPKEARLSVTVLRLYGDDVVPPADPAVPRVLSIAAPVANIPPAKIPTDYALRIIMGEATEGVYNFTNCSAEIKTNVYGAPTYMKGDVQQYGWQDTTGAVRAVQESDGKTLVLTGGPGGTSVVQPTTMAINDICTLGMPSIETVCVNFYTKTLKTLIPTDGGHKEAKEAVSEMDAANQAVAEAMAAAEAVAPEVVAATIASVVPAVVTLEKAGAPESAIMAATEKAMTEVAPPDGASTAVARFMSAFMAAAEKAAVEKTVTPEVATAAVAKVMAAAMDAVEKAAAAKAAARKALELKQRLSGIYGGLLLRKGTIEGSNLRSSMTMAKVMNCSVEDLLVTIDFTTICENEIKKLDMEAALKASDATCEQLKTAIMKTWCARACIKAVSCQIVEANDVQAFNQTGKCNRYDDCIIIPRIREIAKDWSANGVPTQETSAVVYEDMDTLGPGLVRALLNGGGAPPAYDAKISVVVRAYGQGGMSAARNAVAMDADMASRAYEQILRDAVSKKQRDDCMAVDAANESTTCTMSRADHRHSHTFV